MAEPSLDYEQALRMARLMTAKARETEIAIDKVRQDKHGVVALKFSDNAHNLEIEILDAPYDDNVRVYPG